MSTTNFSQAVKNSLIPPKGRRRYSELYKEQLAERVAEHQQLAEAFQSTVKTMNGFAQLASQQVQQIASLSKLIADLRTDNGNGGDDDGNDGKGE